MSYTLRTDKTARETAKAIKELFWKWTGAELLQIPERIDETAEIVFDFEGHPVRIKYGLQDQYRDNLRAIYLTLEGIRMAYKRGLGDLMTNTVSQMLQLGAAAQARDPYEVLGLRPDAPLEVAEASYKALAKTAHPDSGGNDSLMTELNAAIDLIRVARKAGA